jgi:hypothetical protein
MSLRSSSLAPIYNRWAMVPRLHRNKHKQLACGLLVIFVFGAMFASSKYELCHENVGKEQIRALKKAIFVSKNSFLTWKRQKNLLRNVV